MNKLFKRCLVAGTSLLVLTSVGISTNMSHSVQARRHYRTHRIYRHHRSNANSWYERNGKRLMRRDLHHSRLFRRGWKDSHYSNGGPVYDGYARLNPNPHYFNNVNYRHGWIIGRTFANNGHSFDKYNSYWPSIRTFNSGRAYARRHRNHRYVYTDQEDEQTGKWASNADRAWSLNEGI